MQGHLNYLSYPLPLVAGVLGDSRFAPSALQALEPDNGLDRAEAHPADYGMNGTSIRALAGADHAPHGANLKRDGHTPPASPAGALSLRKWLTINLLVARTNLAKACRRAQSLAEAVPKAAQLLFSIGLRCMGLFTITSHQFCQTSHQDRLTESDIKYRY